MYTLAPWRYDEKFGQIVGSDGFAVADVETMPVRVDYPCLAVVDEQDIASGHIFIEREDAEVAANGRLLAAAPQLLAACLSALDALKACTVAEPSALTALTATTAHIEEVIAQAVGAATTPLPLLIRLTEEALETVEAIQRDGESTEATIQRILTTLLPSAPDFDYFYGEPADGRGPSGTGGVT
jgi:hypothetical protein